MATLLHRAEDDTYWLAYHPGIPANVGWWFIRAHKKWWGWLGDKSDVWNFDDYKQFRKRGVEIVGKRFARIR